MPLLNIHIVKGRSEEQITTLLQAIHETTVEAFEVPVRDRYQVLQEHESQRLIMEDTGLGFCPLGQPRPYPCDDAVAVAGDEGTLLRAACGTSGRAL